MGETQRGESGWVKTEGAVPIQGTGRPIHIPSTPFRLSEKEIIRGLFGPPAWSRRLRRIEDWHGEARGRMAQAWETIRLEFASQGARERALSRVIQTLNLAEVNDLIERHNAYFPIEAQLPMDPITGALLHGTEPFQPMAAVTEVTLLAEARAHLMGISEP